MFCSRANSSCFTGLISRLAFFAAPQFLKVLDYNGAGSKGLGGRLTLLPSDSKPSWVH